MENIPHYVPGPKLGTAWKVIPPPDWTSDANIWMIDVQGDDILALEMIIPHSQFWLNYYIQKKLTLFTQIPTVKNHDLSLFLI